MPFAAQRNSNPCFRNRGDFLCCSFPTKLQRGMWVVHQLLGISCSDVSDRTLNPVGFGHCQCPGVALGCSFQRSGMADPCFCVSGKSSFLTTRKPLFISQHPTAIPTDTVPVSLSGAVHSPPRIKEAPSLPTSVGKSVFSAGLLQTLQVLMGRTSSQSHCALQKQPCFDRADCAYQQRKGRNAQFILRSCALVLITAPCEPQPRLSTSLPSL